MGRALHISYFAFCTEAWYRLWVFLLQKYTHYRLTKKYLKVYLNIK